MISRMNRIALVVQTGAVGLVLCAVVNGCAGTARSQGLMAMSSQATNRSVASLLLYQSGITPAGLAAVGASDEQVREVCAVARVLCDAHRRSYGDLLESREHLASVVQTLAAKVTAGQATRADRDALTAARGALDADQSSLDDYATALWQAVESMLTRGQRDALFRIATARNADVPVAFKVLNRSDDEWQELRDQLSVARERGEDMGDVENDVHAAMLLHAARAESVSLQWGEALSL